MLLFLSFTWTAAAVSCKLPLYRQGHPLLSLHDLSVNFPHFPCHASNRQHGPLLTYLFLLGGASLMSLWSPGRGQVLWQGWAGLSLRRDSEWVMATAARYTSQLMKPACDSSRIIYTLPCHARCLSPQHTSLCVHLSSSARTKIRMRVRVICCIGMLQCDTRR